MTNEYAIGQVAEEQTSELADESMCQCEGCKKYRANNPYSIVLSLASRMAMYEWLWGITQKQAQELGIGEFFDRPFGMWSLSDEDEERAMKAWKENT